MLFFILITRSISLPFIAQRTVFTQRTVPDDIINRHSPFEHRSSEAGSLDRTLTTNGQTHRPHRSFTNHRIRKPFSKKRCDLSSPSLPGSYSEPEMPDDHVVSGKSVPGPLPTSSVVSSCKNGFEVLARKVSDIDRADEVAPSNEHTSKLYSRVFFMVSKQIF